MSSPEQIQQQIERTRSSLSGHVDELGDKVSPSRVVHRRVDRVKGSVSGLKERVMGSSNDNTGLRGAAGSAQSSVNGAASTVSDAASSVGDVASSVGQAASNAPQAVRQQTQGNPLAAGLIAFGVGWLLSSLAPATEAEKTVGRQAEDKAREAVEPLKQHAQDMAQQLKEPAQQAVEQVRSTATEAAQQTTEQARAATSDVKAPLQS